MTFVAGYTVGTFVTLLVLVALAVLIEDDDK